MKKYILLLTLLTLTVCSAFAQNTTLKVSLANSTSKSCHIWLPDAPAHVDRLNTGSFDISLNTNGTGTHQFTLTKPQWAYLRCANSEADSAKSFRYVLYLSPGDHIDFKADFKVPGNGMAVTGKGSNNNQPLMAVSNETQLQEFFKDTLPNRVINKLNAVQRLHESNLGKYIALYKPSDDYIKAWKTDLPYIIADDYYDFKENNKYQVWDAYWRNYDSWQKVTDSLFTTAKLDNADALSSIHYSRLVRDFLLRERERLWYLAEKEPQKFFREWYNTDTLTGQKMVRDDRMNIIHEKIVNKYFTGKPEEFAYAVLFERAVQESAPQNIPEIFERFKSKYPNSDYTALFAPAVDVIIAKRKQGLNDKMIFLADNGIKLKRLEDVIAAVKGKTVLVDMWGTWCGPCREEIEKHSASIHQHFKGKNLDYLYIANYDLKNGEQWKKLIAYHQMEGIHMLANDSLTNDIMSKVKGRGFPTTFIIKKDGTIEQSKTQYPINENALVGQLEAALKE